MKEAEAQKAIMEWLSWKHIFHWRNNRGAMAGEYKGKKWFMRFGAVGSPDIFALNGGVCYGIEVKGPKGFQSDAQKEFQEKFENAGGVYILAKGIEDCENVVGAC
jgi:hypothetical protein